MLQPPPFHDACGAELLIADEPTRNLDVTIQAGILKLIDELRRDLRISVLFIANNLGLINVICKDIGVLYRGRIVENGPGRDVIQDPRHPYTRALLSAIPRDKSAELSFAAGPARIGFARGGQVGVVGHPALAKNMRNAVIRGAISHALKIGATYRSAVERGISASERLADSCGGYFLFRGEVIRFDLATVGGFSIGETEIFGEGQYEGQHYRLWFKNENLVSWRNGEVDVTAPDLICMFDDERNYPCIHPNVRVGQKVSVIGLPAPAEWRLPGGLKLLGPRRFGYDLAYIPIEKTHSR